MAGAVDAGSSPDGSAAGNGADATSGVRLVEGGMDAPVDQIADGGVEDGTTTMEVPCYADGGVAADGEIVESTAFGMTECEAGE